MTLYRAVANRHLAPTHPDAQAIHWPEPAPRCGRCGVHGHIRTQCVTELEDDER